VSDEFEIDLSNYNFQALADEMTISPQWAVFPLQARDKKPWGGLSWPNVSKPRSEWGEDWPLDVNVGIDCGKSGLVVIDEDEPDAVEKWLGYVPETYTVQTAKGRHFYFYALGARLKNRVRLAPGVDVRADGGYVVGAGSVHPTGVKYVVMRDMPVQPLPAEIRDHGKDANEIDLDLTKEGRFELPEVIPDGERNETLFKYASSLVGRRLRDGEALVLLREAYGRCVPPYTEVQPEDMLARAFKQYGEPDADETEPSSFVMLDLVALLDPNRPPRAWFWFGLIPEGESASIVAPAGEGKSLLVLGLIVAALLGEEEFIGRALSLGEGRKVLYVDMENSEDDWAERLPDLGMDQTSAGEILGKTLYPFSMPPLSGLDSAKGGRQLLDLIDACGLEKGDVVVLDSTQRITEGDENSNDTMRNLYRHTSTALKRRGLTVIRTDNTGWSSGHERGASAKRDDVGVSLHMTPDPKIAGVYTLTQAKRRFAGEKGDLTYQRVGGNGERLRFIEARGTTFGDKTQDVRDLLTELGVEIGVGQVKAWEAVRKAEEEGLIERPTWMTKALVQKVQSERREVPEVVSEPIPPEAESG
jgi:KaiC/GvpD/RAD55 family RecA-like ATPase